MTSLSTPPPPTTSRAVSRAEIIALGQTGPAPAFIPIALAALAQQPADLELRFLLAAAYARLGLKTPAAEQLALLSPEAQSEPSVKALADLLPNLPDDRVPLAQLVATLAANLEALASRSIEPLDLRGRVNAWKLVNTPVEWFATRSGSFARRKRGDTSAWLQLGDQAEQARAFALPHSTQIPPPYVIEGADPPWLFKRICDRTPIQPDGHAPLVMFLQADEAELLTGLAQCDLTRELADPRVRVFAGPAGLRHWIDWMTERAMTGVAIQCPCLSPPTLRAKMAPSPEQVVTSLVSRQQQEYQRLDAAVKARFSTIDRAALAARFASALAPGATAPAEPLRILIPTYRHSTFIKHAAADLAAALESLGCQARVLMEPDDHSAITNLAHLRTIDEFRPDLVVQINYTRRNMGDLCPPGIVFATWIQDAMGHLFDKGVGASQGPTDFLIGATRDDLFQFFGYPRSRAMLWPMVASARKFHEGPITDEQRRRLECEIAYVSHHGATPEALHAERLAMAAAATPALAPVFAALFEPLKRFVESPALMDPRMSFRLRTLTAKVLADHGISGDHAVTQVLNAYTLQIVDRLLRHQTLAWAADIARRRGWRFHIYGKGWAQHPTLTPFAKGELSHGDDLRAAYQLARAHLQVSAHTVIHQRVAECALSGGLALCRLQGDDLGTLEFQAAAEPIIDGHDPVASDPFLILELGYRMLAYRATDHPATRDHADMCHRLGLGRPELLWMNAVQIERLARRKTYPGRELPARDLLGDPSSVLFASSAALERSLERAIADDAWRSAARARVVASANRWLTYDALAARTLAFIASSLTNPDDSGSPSAQEWYDGRPRP
ncbi:MAG: hypothetical protein K2Q20_05720 [Phycisphaerales bacterium]|nr:hypothetical protein [Phycisphaerales bacterium]